MKIKEFTNKLNKWTPLAYAEDYDNTGLIVGDEDKELKGVLVTLDTTELVVEEAKLSKCNLIVSFHPIIFSGLKNIKPNNYVNRTVIKAIQNEIAIFAIHTALDNTLHGVNKAICYRIGITNPKILIPKVKYIQKLITYVPVESATKVREKLFEAGAGKIGNYSNCSFNMEGLGSFKGNEKTNPRIGKKGILQYEKETQISVIFNQHLQSKIIKQLLLHHPYEEVSYEISTLENSNQNIGLGMVGNLKKELDEDNFLKLLKEKFYTPCIKHSKKRNKPIKKVAVLGGSGAFAISNALQSQVDAYITADLKYHDYFKAENKLILIDIGHYESEQFTKQLIYTHINENFTNFAVVLSNINTNPVQYH